MRRRVAASSRNLAETEGYTAEEIYAQMRRDFEKILDHVREPNAGVLPLNNFRFSARLQKSLSTLLDATPQSLSDCESLAMNGALVDVLRALGHDKKDGALPDNDLIDDYRRDLENHYEQLGEIFPALKKRRKQNRKRRYQPPPPDAKGGRALIAQVVAEHPDVIDKPIAADIAATNAAVEAADEIPAASAEEKKEAMAEQQDRAATQIIPLWSWLANGREKFAKAGKKMSEVADAVEKYDKIYKSLAKAKPYVQWLLGWWFS